MPTGAAAAAGDPNEPASPNARTTGPDPLATVTPATIGRVATF
jgi:hypothetical protein